jgi:hypothetical protein
MEGEREERKKERKNPFRQRSCRMAHTYRKMDQSITPGPGKNMISIPLEQGFS